MSNKKLTPEQQQFLDRLLRVRPQSKGRLGGRQLDKIKGQFADYLRRLRKTEEAVAALERAYGPGAGDAYRQRLARTRRTVEAAAETGDETVFKQAYESLEEVKKGARHDLESRDAQARAIESASEKFEQALDKLRSADPGKQPALARAVIDSCTQWLAKHPGAAAPRISVVMEEAQALSGQPLSRSQGLALGGQLQDETARLCEEIEAVIADDRYIVADTLMDYGGQMARLAQRLERALGEARASGSLVAVKQIERAIAMLQRTQLRADPPPLDDQDDDEAPPQPGDGPGGLLDVPVEQLDNRQQAERALVKSGTLIDQLSDEIERLRAGLAQDDEALRQLRVEFAPLQALLDDDLALIADSLTDATQSLSEAEARLADARRQFALGDGAKDREGAWEDALELVALACDHGLAHVAAADKSMGRAEGGVIYVRAKAAAVAHLPNRLRAFSDEQLDALRANVAVLPACDNVAFGMDGEQRDLLKHLVFVSNDPGQCRNLLGGITDQPSYDQAVKALMKLPKLGSILVTGLLNDCHRFMMDAERLHGTYQLARTAMGNGLNAKFDKVRNLAQLDLGRYTMPIVPRPEGSTQLGSVGVAVVGGGPVGLLAAVEARMAGASQVHVYEGRNDPYSRMNVLKLDPQAFQRMKAAGISEQVCPDPNHLIASVKNIEIALEQRCQALGIKLERDRFLIDVQRDPQGVVHLHFKGDPEPKTCDMLIVATGGSVANAQKHANNVVLGDKLGIPFQKSEVKDYAAVGLFDKQSQEPQTGRERTEGWTYQFETEEVKYIVTQLTEEEFKDWGDNPRKLVEHLQGVARKVKFAPEQQMQPEDPDPQRQVASVTEDELAGALDDAWEQLMADFGGVDNFYGRNKSQETKAVRKCLEGALTQLKRTVEARAKKGGEAKVSPAEVEKSLMNFLLLEFGVARFPIELQQARGFVGSQGEGVLVGDSAGTPHPETAKGLNTGIAEMGAMRDLVQDLMRGDGDEERRKKSLQVYDFEVKRRTDAMISAGLFAMQKVTVERIRSVGVDRTKAVIRRWDGALNWLANDWDPAIRRHLMDRYSLNEQQAREDRDWSRREAAIKTLRGFIPRAEAAANEVIQRAQALLGDNPPDHIDQPLPDNVKQPLLDLLQL